MYGRCMKGTTIIHGSQGSYSKQETKICIRFEPSLGTNPKLCSELVRHDLQYPVHKEAKLLQKWCWCSESEPL